MKRRYVLGWSFLLAGSLAAATVVAAERQSSQAVRKTAEASMVVTGSVEVNPDGTLHGYVLDQPGKLPPDVVKVVDSTMKLWQFSLSRPAQELVKSKVSMRVVASPVGDGNFTVRVEGASFGDALPQDGSELTYAVHKPPTYPSVAITARVSGSVYLLLRVGRDGTVQDVVAEQVNLDQYGDSREMDRFRKVLADSATEAARGWHFNPPTHGAKANDPYWQVRVPVAYSLRPWGTPEAKTPYGKWVAYIPGPRQSPPWISKTLAAESPDAVPDDSLRTGNDGLRLATPLSGA